MLGREEEEPRGLGHSHVGAVWLLFHHGYAAPGLCSAVFLCSGTGDVCYISVPNVSKADNVTFPVTHI